MLNAQPVGLGTFDMQYCFLNTLQVGDGSLTDAFVVWQSTDPQGKSARRKRALEPPPGTSIGGVPEAHGHGRRGEAPHPATSGTEFGAERHHLAWFIP